MKKLVVKKDNALINAAYTLTLVEQRLILLAVAEAAGNSEKLRHTEIYALDYASRFNVKNNVAYEALNDASNQLFERYFSYQKITEKGNVENVKSRWVQSVAYVKNEGTIKIKFADDVLPLLCELKNRFTMYNLEQVSGLTSVYAIRLYELLISWKSTGKTPVYELENFRQKLGIEPNEYKQMRNFKARVLDAAINQINEHSDIIVSYEQFKKGRRITGFSFAFEYKKPLVSDSTRCDKTLELPLDKPLTEKQIGYYAKLLANSSWSGQARILIGVEAKDVISVIMRHLKNPEFVAKNYTAIQKLLNKKGK